MGDPREDLKIRTLANQEQRSRSKALLLKVDARSSCCFFVIVSLLLLLIVDVLVAQRRNKKCTYKTHDHQE